MLDSLIGVKSVKISLGSQAKEQAAIEFAGPPGKVIQESVSKIIDEPCHLLELEVRSLRLMFMPHDIDRVCT